MNKAGIVPSLGLLVLVLATSSAAMEGPPPIAALRAGTGVVEWAPLVEADQIVLTVADPKGLVRTFRFAAGEAPALSLFDERGAALPDGTYTWELRVQPRGNRITSPLFQSGHFTLADGRIIAPDLTEANQAPRAVTAADQMVPDDLIVDGKGCIGLGCVNNEAFGAEALRLKQSVVRLRFQDTSTNASFPSNDWQITANDSASGGANRFSIEDLDGGKTPLTIQAGAPDHSLYMDSTGRIGLGTSTPSQKLHVLGSNGNGRFLVEDVSGTAAPRVLLDLTNHGGVQFKLTDTSLGATWGGNVINGNYRLHKAGASTITFELQGNGNLTIAGVLTQSSDRTAKEDLVSIAPQEALVKVANLPIFVWTYIDDPSGARHLGPMAQDFRNAFGLGEDERYVAPSDLAGVSLAAIQGLHELANEQRRVIEKQQELIGNLEERLRRLEAEQP